MNVRTIYTKLPDSGPLDITDLNQFLEHSKVAFTQIYLKPFKHEETLADFEQLKLLGSGTFGSVILVRKKKTEDYYAMKAIEKKKIIKFKQVDHVKNEKLILKSINFPFTIYLMFFFKDNSYLYFVTPYIPGGELYHHLKKSGKFTEERAQFYVSQVVLALEYLHFLNLAFRDLKPENIVLDQMGYIKLVDFGFCKYLTKNRTYTLCGTPNYLAPEVLLSKGYGLAVDWWGVGIFMYELVAGFPPFDSTHVMRIYEKILNNKYEMPESFSSEMKDLVQNLLQEDLSKRYGNLKDGVNDIKKHSWFKDIDWLQMLNRKLEAPIKPIVFEPSVKIKAGFDKFEPLKVAQEDDYVTEFADF